MSGQPRPPAGVAVLDPEAMGLAYGADGNVVLLAFADRDRLEGGVEVVLGPPKAVRETIIPMLERVLGAVTAPDTLEGLDGLS